MGPTKFLSSSFSVGFADLSSSHSHTMSEVQQLSTAPFDPRFPNQNQTRHCYSSYVDYHRRIRKKGEDYPACEYFRKAYRSLCPNSWIEKWNDQMEAGTFPGKI